MRVKRQRNSGHSDVGDSIGRGRWSVALPRSQGSALLHSGLHNSHPLRGLGFVWKLILFLCLLHFCAAIPYIK